MKPHNSPLSQTRGFPFDGNPFFGNPSAFGSSSSSGTAFGGESSDVVSGASCSLPAFGSTFGPRFGTGASQSFSEFCETSGGVSRASHSVPAFGSSPFTGVLGASYSTTSSSPFGTSMPASSGPVFGELSLFSNFGASSSAISSTPFGNPMPASSEPLFGRLPSSSELGSRSAFGSYAGFGGLSSSTIFGASSSATSSSPFGNQMPASNGFPVTSASAFGSTMPAFGVPSTFGAGASFNGVPICSYPTFGLLPLGPCVVGAYDYCPSSFSASTQSRIFAIPSTGIFWQPYYYFCTQPHISTSGCQVRESPHVVNREVGSRKAPYSTTIDQSDGKCYSFISISSMPVYLDKSHEELRWEDKVAGRQFSSPNPFTPAPLFPSPSNWASFNTMSPAVVSSSPSTTSSSIFDGKPPFLFNSASGFAPSSTPSLFSPSQPVPTFPKNSFQVNIDNWSSFNSKSPAVVSSFPSTTSSSIFDRKPASLFNYPFSFAPSSTPNLSSHTQGVSTFPTNPFHGSRIGSSYMGETAVNDEKPLSVSVDCGISHEELRWEKNGEESARHEELRCEKTSKDCAKAFCVSVTNLDINEADDDDEIVSKLMPKLHKSPEYYSEPKIEELEIMEREEPGSITRVKDFVIGKHGVGSIKFEGPADICQLNLEAMIEFNPMEVIVYKTGNSEGVNTAAEVTLLNIKCFDKVTGRQCVDGAMVEKYRKLLMKKAENLGIEFVSYDPVEGVWKFKVPTLSTLISS